MLTKKSFYNNFNTKSVAKLAKVLNVIPQKKGKNYRIEIFNKKDKRTLALEIYPDILIGKKIGTLISVYTLCSHLQLHFCSGFVISEMLNEVTFVSIQKDKISGLIIEREGGCSLYANVDKKILSGDFTKLGPEVMLSGIALSLTEGIVTEQVKRKKNK